MSRARSRPVPALPTPTGLPKSLCECGHAGDGPNSQHAARYAEGHGPCLVPGCSCKQFTWDRRLTPEEVRTYVRTMTRQTRRPS